MHRFIFMLLAVASATLPALAQNWSIVGTQVQMSGWQYADNVPCVPGVTQNSFSGLAFHPAVLGNDLGLIHGEEANENTPPFPCNPAITYVESQSFARALVDGHLTQMLTIRYGADAHVFASPDLAPYRAIASDTLDITVTLAIAGGPQGFPAIVDYLWDHGGGIGGSGHEGAGEDPCSTEAHLSLTNAGELLQGRFTFTTEFGLNSGVNKLVNQGGQLTQHIGDTLVVHISCLGYAEVNDPFVTPNVQTGDKRSASQWGQITLSLGPPIVTTPPDSLTINDQLEFSVDIGGDAELSDPTPDGNEVFDPGDPYPWHGPLMPLGGADGVRDDASFNGPDPSPDAPDPLLTTAAPVGSLLPPPVVASQYFDLDGYENLDFMLLNFQYGPGFPSIGQFDALCVFEPTNIFVSYDDDAAEHYVADFSTPTDSRSPWQTELFGQTANKDEVEGVAVFPGPPANIYFRYGYLSEADLHANLAPNPDNFADDLDDDVDALDVRNSSCSEWYFSADHEASYTFDPGTIYEKMGGGPGGGWATVVTDTTNLGLPESTDIDAFSFCWLWDESAGRNGLAVLFSVDDNDPLTPQDESGGLDPRIIYSSFMNGVSDTFLTGFTDDIDAIAIWNTPLYAGYAPPPSPCLPVTDLVIHSDGGVVELSFTMPQSANYTVYSSVATYDNPPPPDPSWVSEVDIPGVAGQVVTVTLPLPASGFRKYLVIGNCP